MAPRDLLRWVAQERHNIPDIRLLDIVVHRQIEAPRRVAEEVRHGLALWSEVDAGHRQLLEARDEGHFTRCKFPL
eukprot:3740896-Pyramimonas_sp.AAC.1